jgi:hypothetical protein
MRFLLRKNRNHVKTGAPPKVVENSSSIQTFQSSSSSYDSSDIDSCSSSSYSSEQYFQTLDQVMPMQIWKKYGEYMEKIISLKSSLTLDQVDIPTELHVEDLDFGEVNSIIDDEDGPQTFGRDLNSPLKHLISSVHKGLVGEKYRALNQDTANLIDTFQMKGCLFVEDYVEGCCQGMEFKEDGSELDYNEDDSTYLSCSSNEADADEPVSSGVSSFRHENIVKSTVNTISDIDHLNRSLMLCDYTQEEDRINALENYIFTRTTDDPIVDFGLALISNVDIHKTSSLDSDCGLLSGDKVRNKKNRKEKRKFKKMHS